MRKKIRRNQSLSISNRLLFNIYHFDWFILIVGTTIGPECFRFGIVLVFDNSDHDGQIPISLQTRPERLCCPNSNDDESTIESIRLLLPSHFHGFVVILLTLLNSK